MINWNELQDGLANNKSDQARDLQTLGKAFDKVQGDGMLMLALAVIRQWVIDRKPATEYPFVLPWIEYAKHSLTQMQSHVYTVLL